MIHAVYNVTVEPTTEPISLQSLKDSLRVTTCDFDEELGRLLTAGRRQVENDAKRKLITQTLALYCDRFPYDRVIELRHPPVSSVTSVVYNDDAGASQTFASSKYTAELKTTPPRIVLDEDDYWPNTDNEANSVTITFVAGYGGASAVPAEAKLAITEWVRMSWGKCDNMEHHRSVYNNLINVLAWTAYGVVQ